MHQELMQIKVTTPCSTLTQSFTHALTDSFIYLFIHLVMQVLHLLMLPLFLHDECFLIEGVFNDSFKRHDAVFCLYGYLASTTLIGSAFNKHTNLIIVSNFRHTVSIWQMLVMSFNNSSL